MNQLLLMMTALQEMGSFRSPSPFVVKASPFIVQAVSGFLVLVRQRKRTHQTNQAWLELVKPCIAIRNEVRIRDTISKIAPSILKAKASCD